jgi:hypothetical protein
LYIQAAPKPVIINLKINKGSFPWCLLRNQGDGQNIETEGEGWEEYICITGIKHKAKKQESSRPREKEVAGRDFSSFSGFSVRRKFK